MSNELRNPVVNSFIYTDRQIGYDLIHMSMPKSMYVNVYVHVEFLYVSHEYHSISVRIVFISHCRRSRDGVVLAIDMLSSSDIWLFLVPLLHQLTALIGPRDKCTYTNDQWWGVEMIKRPKEDLKKRTRERSGLIYCCHLTSTTFTT